MFASKTKPRFWREAANEVPLADFVMASAPVSPHDCITRIGDYFRTWRLDAPIPFETATPEAISDAHEAFCNLLHALPGGRCGVYSHRTQLRTHDRLTDPTEPPFSAAFSNFHQDKIAERPILERAYYITLVFRPYPTPSARRQARGGRTLEMIEHKEAEAIAFLTDKGALLERALRSAGPRLLGTRKEGEAEFWEQGEFLSLLINGFRRKVRWPEGPCWMTLPHARLSFGGDKVEIRRFDGGPRRYASMLDFKEYQELVEPGTLNPLLYEQGIEFIETQRFMALPRRPAVKALERMRGQLTATDDAAKRQIRALDQAIEDAADGLFRVGEYHYTLAVFGDTLAEAGTNAAKAMGAITETSSMEIVPVDLVADVAWHAQQPGQLEWVPRRANLQSRAFAALACNHGFMAGKRDGNPWGEALMPLRAPAGHLFYLNLHASPPKEESEGKPKAGNTLVLGPTESGKSAAVCMMLAHMPKFSVRPRVVTFSLHRDTEILTRAMRGIFHRFDRGVPTGIQPLQRTPNPDRIEHWVALVICCLRMDGLPLRPADHENIASAVRAVAAMPAELRWFSTVRQNLSKKGDISLWARFGRWCRGGQNGWVFDMANDRLLNVRDHYAIGFDYTGIMSNPEVKTPIMFELLQGVMVGELIGEPLVCHIAEAWMPLQDREVFAPFLKEQQKTIRKKHGLCIFDTQQVDDLLAHENGRTMVEQSVTIAALPNSKADHDQYTKHLNFTEAEFETIRSLAAKPTRRMLIKQGPYSVEVESDISGRLAASPDALTGEDYLAVLSATEMNLEILDGVLADVGEDPNDFLPLFYQRVRGQQQRARLKVA